MTHRRFAFTFILLAWCAPFAHAAEKVTVVISAKLGPYEDALKGVQEEFGAGVTVLTLSNAALRIPVDSGVVIAIGGKAATQPYPEGTKLIYCLAPGLDLPQRGRSITVGVAVSPTLMSVVHRIKEIQPGMKRLGILWISNSLNVFFDSADEVRKKLGVEITFANPVDPDELPDTLRNLQGKVDALWLPPDPSLISSTNLSTIKGFSWANGVPFYVPSEGLTTDGALASVSSSFHDMGRTAAKAARALLNGHALDATIFPELTKTKFNLGAAKELNLPVDQRLIGAGDQVVP